ncbi:MAG: TnpV protein [Muricoprocola sp.]
MHRNKFVRMAEAHLRENNSFLYNDMILDEKLFPYLKEIGETANRRMEQPEVKPKAPDLSALFEAAKRTVEEDKQAPEPGKNPS